MDKSPFILVAYILFFLIALFLGYIIRSYLLSKPLGMQSFLDKMIYHFTFVHSLGTGLAAVLLGVSEPFGPSGDLMAKTVTVASNFITVTFILSAFVVLFVRYLSIYYGSFIASLEEEQIVSKAYWIIGLASMLLTFMEYVVFSPMELMFSYNVLQDSLDNWKIRIEATALLAMIPLVAIMVVSQYRVEKDAFAHDDLESGFLIKLKHWILVRDQPEDNPEDPSYSVNATRVVFILGMIFFAVAFVMPFLRSVDMKIMLLFGCFFSQILLPLTFIWTHQNLKKHMLQKIRALFCCL